MRCVHPKSECLLQVLVLCFQSSFLLMHTLRSRNDGSSNWVPITHKGSPDGALGCCLQFGSALVVVGIWGVNSQKEDLSFYLSAFQIVLAFLIKIIFLKSSLLKQ